jgi:hypothetical protein
MTPQMARLRRFIGFDRLEKGFASGLKIGA